MRQVYASTELKQNSWRSPGEGRQITLRTHNIVQKMCSRLAFWGWGVLQFPVLILTVVISVSLTLWESVTFSANNEWMYQKTSCWHLQMPLPHWLLDVHSQRSTQPLSLFLSIVPAPLTAVVSSIEASLTKYHNFPHSWLPEISDKLLHVLYPFPGCTGFPSQAVFRECLVMSK